MKKRMIALLTAVVMILSVMPVAAFAGDGELTCDGNLLKVTTVSDFNAGTMTGMEVKADVGNGALVLSDGETEGTFVSAVYNVTAFTKMVASWSASIYDGTSVEIWAQARQDGNWSGWMSWGPYSPYISRGSQSNKGCPTATLNDDIFSMDEGTADAVQLMAVVRRSSAEDQSPELRQINLTFAGGDSEPVYAEDRIENLPDAMLNEAPAYAQGIRHPSIGGSICSPTTMSVMLNSRDASLDLFPEEIALNVQDEGEGIFGNWSFTASGAGLYGYECYAQYADLDILLQELAHGRTVGCSVSYSPDPSSSYPYLEGSYGGTGGHLITIIGYEYEDGIQDEEHLYLYSSDSYSKDDSTSYHRYKWTQFINAWGTKAPKMAYIIPSLTIEEGAAVTGVTRVYGALQSDPADRTLFTFVDEGGDTLDMTRFVSGGGLLGYTVEGFSYDELQETSASVIYENRVQVTANNMFYYNISCTEDGQVKLDVNSVLEGLGIAYGETRDITVYAFSDRGYLYIATLEDATIQADEVIVLPQTECSSAKAESRIYEDSVDVTLTVNDLSGDTIYVGVLIPEDAVVDADLIYTTEEGVPYLTLELSAEDMTIVRTVDWFNDGNARRYVFNLAPVNRVEDIVVVDGNVVSVDLENGRTVSNLELWDDGALALAEGETYGEYYSPVYDSFDWEYAMASLNAYLPGTSSVDMQIRVYTQKGEEWSDWYSFGKQGVGSASSSSSMKDDYVNMDTDVFSIRGASSIANALRFQVRFIFRGDGKDQPAVYHGEITYKKSSYDPDEAVSIGETAVADLPAAAGKDIEAYSAYAYASGMAAWRFENMELMMLNTQGADLLFEEVALASYDQSAGWGNWTMTNYKPGAFGYRAYSQFGANSTLIQQAIADGNLVGVYVHGGRLPSTNSSSSSQTVVYAYYTAEDGTVMFKVCCPRGDTSELNGGDVYGEVSAEDLDYAIAGFSSSSARGIMYVVGEKEYASS